MPIRSSSLSATTTLPIGGPAGLRGKDNYQLWLANGKTGTVEDFLEAYRGPKGAASTIPGPEGKRGPAGAGMATDATRGAMIAPNTFVVQLADKTVVTADPKDISHQGKVLGYDADGGEAGSTVLVPRAGYVAVAAANLADGEPVFIGDGATGRLGAPVSAPPTASAVSAIWRQQVGTASGADGVNMLLDGPYRVPPTPSTESPGSGAGRARLVDDSGLETSPLLADAILTGIGALAAAGNADAVRELLAALAQAADGSIAPSAVRISGAGSTGDVSGMSVKPAGSTIGSSLSDLLAYIPKITGGNLSILNGPTIGQFFGSRFASYADGCYINRQLTWPSTYLPGFPPHPDYVTDYVVAPNGQNTARLSATRTSDITASGVQNTIAATALLVGDSTDPQKGGWARYTQVNIPAGSAVGLALGEENSVENLSSYSVAIDPFSDIGIGSKVTSNLRLTSGVGRPANDISANLQITNNGGARSLAGIVIGTNALNTDSGYAPVVAMPPGVGFSWYNGPGSLGWRIFQNSNSGSGTIVLGNNTFDLYVGSGHTISAGVNQIGFNGASPVGKQILSAPLPTDGSATSAQLATACNNLRTALINLGLGQ